MTTTTMPVHRRTLTRLTTSAAGAALTAVLATGCATPAQQPCDTELVLSNTTTGTTATLTESVAISVQEGAGYTVWAADFAFDETVTAWFDPAPPPEGNLAWISLTVFNATGEVAALQVGDRIPADAPHGEHVLVVVHRTSDGDYGQSEGAVGEAVLTQVDGRLCAQVDYRDAQKTLQGTVGVSVLEG